jgi:transcriptional regulator with XRE-family HTH domain
MPLSKPMKIKENRIKSGFSMRGLAEKCSLNCATISRIEHCSKAVNPQTAKAICEALQVPFNSLFEIPELKEGE